jgi:hypothetical protein
MELTAKQKQTLDYSTRELDGETYAGVIIETLAEEVVGAKGDISTLQEGLSTAQGDISDLEETVSGIVQPEAVLVYDDLRITPGSFDRPGNADPVLIPVTPGGSGITTYLYEWAKDDIASFVLQLPHGYKEGEAIRAHIHWTPGPRGVAENTKTVGWKIDYSWASIDGNFGAMQSLDLSDVCDGTNWKHQMSPSGEIVGTGKGISSMILCNISRTDTGTDDTWVGTISGQLPMLLEVDFHFPIDTLGSSDWGTK